MQTPARFILGGTIAVAIALSATRGPNAPLAANLSTPAPTKCAMSLDGGTPVASPEPMPGTATPVAHVDEANLIAALEAQGITVEEAGSIEQPFFNAVRVDRLILNGGWLAGDAELQIYVYADAETLAADVDQVTPDGNLNTVMIEWIADPHFFCAGNLMVIYLGDDQEAIDLLTTILGPQFAGR